ncbi:tRNA pseudouridine synthase-like 1 isoform X1 [Dermatophagoides pteronyssinus]|uniref:tRNA pseudouridine synthase-like 1 isoform X1 n=2 Tax=Dermatophagoides pteronyssinus TaxID=6956 RepID=UPI003F68210A
MSNIGTLCTCRYFLKIAYIGTRYKGVQRQTRRCNIINDDDNGDGGGFANRNKPKNINNDEDGTIQAAIENSMNRALCPVYGVRLALSSRTDSGVHAIMNTANVDLTHPLPDTIYRPTFILSATNRLLSYSGHDITISDVRLVSSTFHSRINAKYRSYKYRFATFFPNNNNNNLFNNNRINGQIQQQQIQYDQYRSLLPITWINRCHIVSGPLNISAMIDCCSLLRGRHNFCNFTTLSSENRYRDPRKTIEKFQLYKLPIDTIDSSSIIDNNNEIYKIEFYEFFIQANSFLYNQIRRMIAAIIDVGCGHISIDELRSMLPENVDDDEEEITMMSRRHPISNDIYKRLSTMVPACGLYLVDVGYDEQDFKLDENFNDYSPKTVYYNEKSFDYDSS